MSFKLAHLRWYICGLVFLATVINYLDRQVFSILAPQLQKEIGWNDLEYGRIVIAFQFAYAAMMLLSGPIIDRIGTKLSFSIAVVGWSAVEIAHAFVRTAFGFGVVRFLLALTEAANFPAGAKAVAEWFQASERALATGIFISGVGLGAILASLAVPPLNAAIGWQGTFIVTGILGFVWFIAWQVVYRPPAQHPWLTDAERSLIPTPAPQSGGERTRWVSLLPLRQTWAYALAKSLTDPVWWFFLFWLPKFLAESYDIRGVAVVPYLTVVYICADVGSLTSGYVSSALIKRGWNLNAARKTTFAAIAVLITPILVATAFTTNPVTAIALIACATGLHQAWSAIVWTLPTDLFPSRATGSASGIGACLASVAAIVTAEVTGRYLTAHPGTYAPLFLGAACLYPLALLAVHLCSPKMEPAQV